MLFAMRWVIGRVPARLGPSPTPSNDFALVRSSWLLCLHSVSVPVWGRCTGVASAPRVADEGPSKPSQLLKNTPADDVQLVADFVRRLRRVALSYAEKHWDHWALPPAEGVDTEAV